MYNALIKAGYSEAEVAAQFNISHKELRQHLKDPSPMLCPAALKEIELFYDDVPRAQLAKMYRCSILGLAPKKQPPELTAETVHSLWNTTDLSIKDLAKLFKVAKARIVEILGLVEPKVSLNQKIAAFSHLKPREAAQKLGCSVATVYCYRNKQGLSNPQATLTEEDWAALLASKDTVTNKARKYGVSRAAIYKRMNKA